MRIVKSPENSSLLIQGVSETIENEAKEQKGGFISMLLGTLYASLLGNLLLGKGFVLADQGTAATSRGGGTIRAGEGGNRAGHDC